MFGGSFINFGLRKYFEVMAMEEPIVIGKDKFRISEEETAKRELRVLKVDENVIQVQEEVHGIIALVGASSSVNIKKEELKNLIKVAKEEFGWTDICE
jgi:hypothetical protein